MAKIPSLATCSSEYPSRCCTASHDRTLASGLAILETLIHLAGWFLVGASADEARGHSRSSTLGRDPFQYDTAGSDLGTRANLDVAENSSPGSDHNAFANFRVAIAHILAGSAQRNTLKHGDSVLDNGSLADDDAGAVINHDSRAEP